LKSALNTNGRRSVSFASLGRSLPIPHFLNVQRDAFQRLIEQKADAGSGRGLGQVFRDIFPLDDSQGRFRLEFKGCRVGEAKYTVDECIDRDMTYAAPLLATLQLVRRERGPGGNKRVVDIKEKEVYLGDLPLLTDYGTFLINGAQRVVVSQLHRSPGVVFEEKLHPNGTKLRSARIIPFRGSWVEFGTDIHGVVRMHIDKTKKFPATALLRALGYSSDLDIVEAFLERRTLDVAPIAEENPIRREVVGNFIAETVVLEDAVKDLVLAEARAADFDGGDAAEAAEAGAEDEEPTPLAWFAEDVGQGNKQLAGAGEPLLPDMIEVLTKAGIESVKVVDNEDGFVVRRGEVLTDEALERLVRSETPSIELYGMPVLVHLRGTYPKLARRRDWSVIPQLARDVIDEKTGEVLARAHEKFDQVLYTKLRKQKVGEVMVFAGGSQGGSSLLRNTLERDPTLDQDEALRAIYRLVRPGEAPNIETAKAQMRRLFFDEKRYDLGRVGRHKLNRRLNDIFRLLGLEQADIDLSVLHREDFVAILRYLMELYENRGYTDDIDHLGNRRVRSVGELIAQQLSLGLSRMARLVRERMTGASDPDKLGVDDLVNARTVSAVIQTFFGSSQLSQFMDQTNPLAELTHKRRLSALGPGGLTRERAGFEVRDVHYSHYGRMCPIETPEGPNIGLITSMTTYSRLNELGFLETPYRRVREGRVSEDIVWLSASDEEEFSVAQASAPLNPDGTFVNELVLCRSRDDYPLLPPSEIDFMDVAPDQLVAVSPALIPFLEHDDANRALMGSNMQRQAVPLLFPQRPLVGTGLEGKVASDSGSVLVARRSGTVASVDADHIVVDTGHPPKGSERKPLAGLTQFDHYKLRKFWRTNQDTALNQRPVVSRGQKVARGQVIADGAGTDGGALALGRNALVAFMPWHGHNFEDAIIVSESLVKDDGLTSVHIHELEVHVRDTKRGMEEITREIPNISQEKIVDLDDRGIVRMGAFVQPGDILVGKITPKGETELSPEEKLLTAIFGEKAKDVRDSSLKVPTGLSGTVIEAKIFSRRSDDQLLEREHGNRISELREQERVRAARVKEVRDDELREILRGQTVSMFLRRADQEEVFREGAKLTPKRLEKVDFGEIELLNVRVKDPAANEAVRAVIEAARDRIESIRERTEEGIDKIFQPDELSPGVVQLVKVRLAEKRKIAVGDKMAGRHGNKGIIAKVVPEEDMPVLPDGRPVEIVLNPLGVPSRMNVGQILETLLGWTADVLGFEAHTPVFEGATEHELGALLKLAGVHWSLRALGSVVEAPPLPPALVQELVAEIQAVTQAGGTPHDDIGEADESVRGLGRPLGAYQTAGGPKLKAHLKELSACLRKAAADLWGEKVLVKDLKGAGLDNLLVRLMNAAGLRPSGKMRLRDGRSGEEFDADVTVGQLYMMKLSHLVDDKIHARSVGPYSLVTQQPLAGKAQQGGQRFGEMEVWALEAYGASHTLQEMLTIKSDDMEGRRSAYSKVVKGENLTRPGTPESFNVLKKELNALGLKVLSDAEEMGEDTERGRGIFSGGGF